ncbi:MAG: hypothetical protein OJF60_001685 [Burkholderiaceae bacterium]|jgi:type IV pilus assembly protein PilX|nr:MAG: hypothetical protein OJF60_001685 [Burkholderiaceae bacterium]
MTLLVGLVLLVMLMVVSVIGFRNTTLSTRMTGNAVDRQISFQSAENAGKETLQVIESGGFGIANAGHYDPPLAGAGGTKFWTGDAGASVSPATCTTTTTSFNWTSCAAQVATAYTGNAERASYVIELLSQQVNSGSTVSTYRVTSRSTGGSGDAAVVLQTIYSRTTTP